MNGNITEDGIAKDLAWMKRVGIGGLQNFDANIRTPQIVDKPLIYMQPDWKRAFRFAAAEADRLGLELAIAASPGYSETGGPWVTPQDALKKLVWSETDVIGDGRSRPVLATPPNVTGPFQSLPKQAGMLGMLAADDAPPPSPFYADVAVLAFPLAPADRVGRAALVRDGAGASIDGRPLVDDDLTSGIELAKPAEGPATLEVAYAAPRTVRSARLFTTSGASDLLGAAYLPALEAGDGKTWRKIADVPLLSVPTTVAFAPTSATHFRLVFNRPKGGGASAVLPIPAPGVDVSGMTGALRTSGQRPKGIELRDFHLYSEDRVDRAETKAAFALTDDYYALSQGIAETQGVRPSDVVDLTGRLRSDGTLDWVPPRGNWRVLRLGYSLVGTTNHPAVREATGLEVDKFDGAAVRRYLDHYLALYKDAAGTDLVGKRGVRALLTDSIEVGAANWTPRLIQQFRHLRGYDPTPWLPVLTGTLMGSRQDSDRFLYDFRRTLSDLMASEHYGTLATVAHENGLTVYGEALEGGRPSLGDDMAMRRYADVPMGALWAFQRKIGPAAPYLADMKGAASVAHIYGQNLVGAESMTAGFAPWAFGPEDLKRVVDLEFVTGVNRPIIHTSVHVPTDDKKPGLSLFIFGQYFNRNEAWAELARPWIDYIARNSFMLQQGRNVADLGYFYGEEAPLTGLYGTKRVTDAPTSVAYDFVNADALNNALSNDGIDLVSPGGARYRALYLGGSSRRMTLGTLRTLAKLVEGGATVIGSPPESDPGLSGDRSAFEALKARLWAGRPVTRVGKGRVIVASNAEAAFSQVGIMPDFRFTGGTPDAEIPFLHRRLVDGDSYFLVNRLNQPEVIQARFRVTGKAPELWHAETGRSEPVSYRIEGAETIVPLTLTAEQSVHVVFRKPASGPSLTLAPPVETTRGTVSGPWRVTFQAGRGAPAEAIFPVLAPLDEHGDPGIRYFSGVATYSNSFVTPRGWKRGEPLWLDLGEAREVAQVTVNGKPAGYAWHAPYRVDVSALAKPGRNALNVRVANLWVNRLIGDKQPGATPITWTALPTYTAKAPLRRSGLVGPVTLVGRSGK